MIKPLNTQIVPIDLHSTGERWELENSDDLSRLIAVVLLGQASYAGTIIGSLSSAVPLFTHASLKAEAIVKLTVQDVKVVPRVGYPRWQRDGLIFEIISWIAAHQQSLNGCLLKDPHLKATSQGLDGLMIEMMPGIPAISQVTIFEDKCTAYPKSTFDNNVITGFSAMHTNERVAELVATATHLIVQSGLDIQSATNAASKVLDIKLRRYRAAFALMADMDNEDSRKNLFGRYEDIKGIGQKQKIGASFIVDGDLRTWFDQFALNVIQALENFDEEVGHNV